ncbi:MAG: hypothetical protein LIR46_09290, partial [Bacteroidota bacterium]|nr:hypothetical protein [Bacteroidota bacterium]
MICLKCDICGNAFDFGGETRNHARFMHISSTGNSNKIIDRDICPECYLAIKKTLDERRKRTNPIDDD